MKIHSAVLKKVTHWSGRCNSWSSSIILIANRVSCLWGCCSCCWRGCSCGRCVPCCREACRCHCCCCSLVTPLIPSLHSVQSNYIYSCKIKSLDQYFNQLLNINYGSSVRIRNSFADYPKLTSGKLGSWTESMKGNEWIVLLQKCWCRLSPVTEMLSCQYSWYAWLYYAFILYVVCKERISVLNQNITYISSLPTLLQMNRNKTPL
jgi:hypothetical protein